MAYYPKDVNVNITKLVWATFSGVHVKGVQG